MSLELEDQGKLVKQAREEANLTQQELADRTGLKHAQSVSRIERGVTSVPMGRLRRIAEATGKPLSYFVGEQNGVGLQPEDREQLAEAVRLLAEIAPRFASALTALEGLVDELRGPQAVGSSRRAKP